MADRKFMLELKGYDPGPSRTSPLSPEEEYLDHLEKETVENKANWPYMELEDRRRYVTELREQDKARRVFMGETLGFWREKQKTYPGIDLFKMHHKVFEYMLRSWQEDDWISDVKKPRSVIEGDRQLARAAMEKGPQIVFAKFSEDSESESEPPFFKNELEKIDEEKVNKDNNGNGEKEINGEKSG